MFVYKNVVRYGRYCPSIVKNKKIKLKKMKCQQRILNLQVKKLESYIQQHNTDEKNFPFLL
tara:strand:+ start:2354 stop:2536 length:183 start_codon:yes stop_codon:yes gene_type:complete